MAKIRRDGKVFQPVYIELPAGLHRRLEIEKTRRGSSFNAIILGWIQHHLEALPEAPQPGRIET
jgi:hypothetical protein